MKKENIMEKIKIAYCIPALYYPSGMERVLTLKANYLDSQGYEIHIIITDGGQKIPAFSLNPLVRVHQLDIDFEEPYRHTFLYRVWLYRAKMKTFRKKLNTCLCQIKPDITVSLLRRDINIINKMTDGSLKMGEIHFDRLHYRHFTAAWMPSYLYTFLQRHWMRSLLLELKKLSVFVVLTHEDATLWPELTNVKVIPNPTSVLPNRVADCSQKQVIAVGRYVYQKGFDRLIVAWKVVASKYPDWVLKIYGDGSMREQLQTLINEYGIENNCILEHSVTNIDDKYCESSIFVLSSRFEGFGLVIVEAMTCGLPVIAFACHCGPRDIISDEKDGLLIQEGDIDHLAKAIIRLIEDENFRLALGHNAITKSMNYTIEKIGAQWVELFESLLHERRENI